ncbi:DUF1697 domain-containing protein [Cohnella nanjingensis]|uniref:DUF1697 domain-containing protein n=1 Tax=Cohnella nanjingensis TaxID=1387779 RepID=A0A7X0RQ97_9BACL|nr:DUF1697 domain-containing protein [Cohnella nanjingensis]MBB6670440.1 DUF1697 domain-containing protein [Cohnella nanjingensis]
MAVYVGLLRGINVGGNNKVKMDELKRMFAEMGFARVQTYIQSGNVLFASDEDEETLRARIEPAFEARFGFSSRFVFRTAEELENILARCPFTAEEIAAADAKSEKESLYVSMLTEAPPAESLAKLNSSNYENESFRIVGRDVYLLFDLSIRNSKLGVDVHKMKIPSTNRNWKTITKLAAMAREMAE